MVQHRQQRQHSIRSLLAEPTLHERRERKLRARAGATKAIAFPFAVPVPVGAADAAVAAVAAVTAARGTEGAHVLVYGAVRLLPRAGWTTPLKFWSDNVVQAH